MDINALPKAELHVHIEGTISPQMATRLAERNNMALSDGLIGADGTYQWKGFPDFIATYDKVAACVRTAKDYTDITYDYLKRCADQSCLYVEILYSSLHAFESAGLSHEQLLEALAEGMDRAKAETGIESRLIATAIRHCDPHHAMILAQECAAIAHPYVTGFGIAGAEREDDIFAFAEAFRVAKDKAGLRLTAHAGEACGPRSIKNLLKAVPEIERLGHGVRVAEDPELTAELAREKIVFEICPSSNIEIGIFPDWDQHTLPQLIAAGCRVTLNSDDPPFFFTDIGQEYQRAKSRFDLTEDQLLGCTRTAIEAAFVEAEVRDSLLAQMEKTILLQSRSNPATQTPS